MTEPENLVLQILREMRAEMATKSDIASLERNIADVQSETKSGFANVAADFIEYDKQLKSLVKRLNGHLFTIPRQVSNVELNLAHHGTDLSDLEERILRLEARLDAAPGAH